MRFVLQQQGLNVQEASEAIAAEQAMLNVIILSPNLNLAVILLA